MQNMAVPLPAAPRRTATPRSNLPRAGTVVHAKNLVMTIRSVQAWWRQRRDHVRPRTDWRCAAGWAAGHGRRVPGRGPRPPLGLGAVEVALTRIAGSPPSSGLLLAGDAGIAMSGFGPALTRGTGPGGTRK